jgi:hypothetical protein
LKRSRRGHSPAKAAARSIGRPLCAASSRAQIRRSAIRRRPIWRRRLGQSSP